jgi:hypothetical protein
MGARCAPRGDGAAKQILAGRPAVGVGRRPHALHQPTKPLTHRRCASLVMPAKAGIHDFLCSDKSKSWIPACAGMTRWVSPESRSFGHLVLQRRRAGICGGVNVDYDLIPGAERNDPADGWRSSSSRSVVPGRGGFRSCGRRGQLTANEQSSNQARRRFYHRGTRKNDRVHGEQEFRRYAQEF